MLGGRFSTVYPFYLHLIDAILKLYTMYNGEKPKGTIRFSVSPPLLRASRNGIKREQQIGRAADSKLNALALAQPSATTSGSAARPHTGPTGRYFTTQPRHVVAQPCWWMRVSLFVPARLRPPLSARHQCCRTSRRPCASIYHQRLPPLTPTWHSNLQAVASRNAGYECQPPRAPRAQSACPPFPTPLPAHPP